MTLTSFQAPLRRNKWDGDREMENKAAGHKQETSGIMVEGTSCWTSTVDVKRQQERFRLTQQKVHFVQGLDVIQSQFIIETMSKICDFTLGNSKLEASYPYIYKISISKIKKLIDQETIIMMNISWLQPWDTEHSSLGMMDWRLFNTGKRAKGW